MFQSSAINVTTEGHKHLGAVIGSDEYQKDYVDGKVTEWVGEIVKLAEIATTEPQACYSAYIFGFKHKWTLFDGITDSSSLQVYMLYDVACLLQSHLLVRTHFIQIQFYNVTLIQSGNRS